MKLRLTFTATFEIIAATTAKQDKIVISGFGSFQGKVRAERKGRNPPTGIGNANQSLPLMTFLRLVSAKVAIFDE